MRTTILVIAAALLLLAAKPGGAESDWPQWRGPQATGVSADGDPPVRWSETENVRWKVEIPGKGLSTPIVWKDRVYLTTAIPYGKPVAATTYHGHDDGAHGNVAPLRPHRFVVLALERTTGKIVWRKTLRDERPHEATHETGSWASASPVTDGQRLYVSFGSRGLFAVSMKGDVVWEKDLGDMRTFHEHGEGSSPALHDGTLVVNWDHQDESFIVALDAKTGKERWRAARDEITSWSSPLIVEHDGKAQVIVAATGFVRGYDLKNGKEIWRCAGLSRNVVATPVAADGIVYVGNSYDWQALLAIDLSKAKGDITGTDAVVWKKDKHTPYVPSPLLDGDELCYLRHLSGVLTCVDARTGAERYGPARLPGAVRNVFASPVGASGRIYVASRDGATAVLRRGGEYEVLAVNTLDDSFSASPAVAGDELFLRGERRLYCIAKP